MRNHSGEKRRRPRRYFATASVGSPFSPLLPPVLSRRIYIPFEGGRGRRRISSLFFLGLVGPLDLGALSFLWRGKNFPPVDPLWRKKNLNRDPPLSAAAAAGITFHTFATPFSFLLVAHAKEKKGRLKSETLATRPPLPHPYSRSQHCESANFSLSCLPHFTSVFSLLAPVGGGAPMFSLDTNPSCG